MNRKETDWVTEHLAVTVGVIGIVHLSFIPGPSADIVPTWITALELHIIPYAAVSIALGVYAIQNHSRRMMALPLLNSCVLIVVLGVLFTDTVTVSPEVLDSLSVAVPTLLALALYSVHQTATTIHVPES